MSADKDCTKEPSDPYGSVALRVDDLKLLRKLASFALSTHRKLDPADVRRSATVIQAITSAIDEAAPLLC